MDGTKQSPELMLTHYERDFVYLTEDRFHQLMLKTSIDKMNLKNTLV